MLPRIVTSSPCRFELNPFKIRNTEERIFETVSLLIGQADFSDCAIHVVNKRTAMLLAVQDRHTPHILHLARMSLPKFHQFRFQ